MDQQTFTQLVREALAHLHNRGYLEAHRLAVLLSKGGRPLSGDALHTRLLDAIEQLKPSSTGPAHEADWRRYRNLVLRYAQGLNLEQVARELAVSTRQCTRDHQQAIEELASLLLVRYGPPDIVARWSSLPDTDNATPSGGTVTEQTVSVAEVAASDNGPTDLSETLQGVLSTMRTLADNLYVSFETSLADTLPPVAVGRTLLRQALFNLLMYTTQVVGSGRVVIASSDTGQGVTLRVDVVDYGTGRSTPRHTPRARLPDPVAEELLSAGQNLIEAQGGIVEVSTIAADDSTYHAVSQPLLSVTLPPARRRTILIIDDNLDFVGLFRRFLHDRPYRIIQASTAERALELAFEVLPDLITLDVLMPEIDGWDILRQLRTHESTRHIPVIVCSVLPERALALSLGVADFLAKPITRSKLLAVLERWCPLPEEHPIRSGANGSPRRRSDHRRG